MSFGSVSPSTASRLSRAPAASLSRVLTLAEWAEAGIPLLRDPRETVTALYDRHTPELSTTVVAVLDHEQRLRASASFSAPAASGDGWQLRNAILTRLRQVIPHDLRLRSPVRTAVLLNCREGDGTWTESDGAWMWGLRDACTLHGLRCGSYVAMTRDGWHVLGEGRGGRRPRPGAPRSPAFTDEKQPPADAPRRRTALPHARVPEAGPGPRTPAAGSGRARPGFAPSDTTRPRAPRAAPVPPRSPVGSPVSPTTTTPSPGVVEALRLLGRPVVANGTGSWGRLT